MTSNILDIHKDGKVETRIRILIHDKKRLNEIYGSKVSEPCTEIFNNKDLAYKYTSKGNNIAIVTDGSAVLGLGNIGPEAALPMVEGKSVLFKKFAGINAYPICLKTNDIDEFVKVVKSISPSFGGISLDYMSSPDCFEVERKLKEELDIPIFHDYQHSLPIIVFTALKNALRVTGKKLAKIEVVVSGAGAAGIGIAKFLNYAGVKNILVVDSQGILFSGRKENMNFAKEEVAKLTNPNAVSGRLQDAIKGKDVFIGVSVPKIISKDMIESMNSPIVFALANPIPEISRDDALKAGVEIFASSGEGPNQLDSNLVFPGVSKALLELKANITDTIKLAVANTLAGMVKTPTKNKLVPDIFNKSLVWDIVNSVNNTVKKSVIKKIK